MLSPSSEHSQRSTWEIFLGFGISFVRRANLFVSSVSSASVNKCPCQKMIIWKGICLSCNTLHLFGSLTYVYSKVFSKCYMGIIPCHFFILILVSKYLPNIIYNSIDKIRKVTITFFNSQMLQRWYFQSLLKIPWSCPPPPSTWLTIHSILLASRDLPHIFRLFTPYPFVKRKIRNVLIESV